MIRSLIIEDEPEAINVLKRYIDVVDDLVLVGAFRNPLKAYSALGEDIDVLFLDINMPNVSGLAFLRTLSKKPYVILTTAYSEFAVESYELNVTDYLLKPISIERFMLAITKVREHMRVSEILRERSDERKSEIIFLKSGTQTFKVNIKDILFVEKQSNYLCFRTDSKKILVRGNMSDVFDWISATIFLRVHKSFVVNINRIDSIENHELTVDKFKIPFGELYKEDAMKKIMQG